MEYWSWVLFEWSWKSRIWCRWRSIYLVNLVLCRLRRFLEFLGVSLALVYLDHSRTTWILPKKLENHATFSEESRVGGSNASDVRAYGSSSKCGGLEQTKEEVSKASEPKPRKRGRKPANWREEPLNHVKWKDKDERSLINDSMHWEPLFPTFPKWTRRHCSVMLYLISLISKWKLGCLKLKNSWLILCINT